MFVHAPEDNHIEIRAFVLWDNPDFARHALELCEEVEQRVENARFHLKEASAQDVSRGNGIDPAHPDVSRTDLVLVALSEMTKALPFELREWFYRWADSRHCEYGALAALRPLHCDGAGEIHQIAHDSPGHWPPATKEEESYQQFLKNIAERAKVDFMWGAVQSDLEDATRNFRYLPSLDEHLIHPNKSHELENPKTKA